MIGFGCFFGRLVSELIPHESHMPRHPLKQCFSPDFPQEIQDSSPQSVPTWNPPFICASADWLSEQTRALTNWPAFASQSIASQRAPSSASNDEVCAAPLARLTSTT